MTHSTQAKPASSCTVIRGSLAAPTCQTSSSRIRDGVAHGFRPASASTPPIANLSPARRVSRAAPTPAALHAPDAPQNRCEQLARHRQFGQREAGTRAWPERVRRHSRLPKSQVARKSPIQASPNQGTARFDAGLSLSIGTPATPRYPSLHSQIPPCAGTCPAAHRGDWPLCPIPQSESRIPQSRSEAKIRPRRTRTSQRGEHPPPAAPPDRSRFPDLTI